MDRMSGNATPLFGQRYRSVATEAEIQNHLSPAAELPRNASPIMALEDIPRTDISRCETLQHTEVLPVAMLGDIMLPIQTLLSGPTADEFRNIKRPLISNVRLNRVPDSRFANVILVTSAEPGEGKTFVAANLAGSLAKEEDYSALLVDMDFRKPSITAALEMESEPGVLDVLLHEHLAFPDLIWPTDIDGLSLVPCGATHIRASELVSSERMRQCLAEAASLDKNRFIVIDASPLLVASESRVLANLAGQIILVVEEGRTSQSAVNAVIQMLSEDDAFVGLVLNKEHIRKPKRYLRYYK